MKTQRLLVSLHEVPRAMCTLRLVLFQKNRKKRCRLYVIIVIHMQAEVKLRLKLFAELKYNSNETRFSQYSRETFQ